MAMAVAVGRGALPPERLNDARNGVAPPDAYPSAAWPLATADIGWGPPGEDHPMMTDTLIPRRRFLTGAAAAAGGLVGRRSAQAQGNAASVPAARRVPEADTVLKNGRIVMVDAAFTIAQAIAIAGDRILAVGSDDAVA